MEEDYYGVRRKCRNPRTKLRVEFQLLDSVVGVVPPFLCRQTLQILVLVGLESRNGRVDCLQKGCSAEEPLKGSDYERIEIDLGHRIGFQLNRESEPCRFRQHWHLRVA